MLENLLSDEEVAFLQNEAWKLLVDPAVLNEATVITEPDSPRKTRDAS